jgi:predicted enzyme related to lactoylglutathione lyase
MDRNPVGWFEIYVQDMARARAFYEVVFDTKLQQLETSGIEMWSFPAFAGGQGTTGALVYMEGFDSGANSVIVYFMCEDCAKEAKLAADNGGRIVKDKFPIGEHGFIVLVTDTEGNMIGLHSMQ